MGTAACVTVPEAGMDGTVKWRSVATAASTGECVWRPTPAAARLATRVPAARKVSVVPHYCLAGDAPEGM